MCMIKLDLMEKVTRVQFESNGISGISLNFKIVTSIPKTKAVDILVTNNHNLLRLFVFVYSPE